MLFKVGVAFTIVLVLGLFFLKKTRTTENYICTAGTGFTSLAFGIIEILEAIQE